MAFYSTSKLSSDNGNGKLKVDRSSYLKRIRDALSNSLSKMEMYEEENYILKSNTIWGSEESEKRVTRLPFYPYVELETKPIETETILDLQRIRPFGTNGVKHRKECGSTAATRTRESCFIESTSNSVRISFLFKAQVRAKEDPLEASIVFQWMRFLMVQEQHPLLRKVPVEGYSVTFLVTNRHLAIYGHGKILDSILAFCAKIDKECSDIKLQVNAQARYVTTEFLKAFNNHVDLEEEKSNA